MSGILWRVIIAVIAVLLIFALIPPVLHVFGIMLSADVEAILRICIGGIAIFYVLKGPPFPA